MRYRPIVSSPKSWAWPTSGKLPQLARTSTSTPVARARRAGRPRRRPHLRATARARFVSQGELLAHALVGPEPQNAFGRLENREVTVARVVQQFVDARQGRYAQRARQDRGVTGQATFLGRDADHAISVCAEQIDDRQLARDQDVAFGRLHQTLARALAFEVAQHTHSDIAQVDGSFAQELVLDQLEDAIEVEDHLGDGGFERDLFAHDQVLDIR